MTFEKMTNAIDLEELEVEAEEVVEVSAGLTSAQWTSRCTMEGKLL